MSFIGELQRRNVFRVGVAYVVTVWLLLQIADTLMDAVGTPDWVMRALLTLALLGFPPALIFAWAFEITPDGIKREREVQRDNSITQHTAHKLDITIIVMLVILGGFMVWESRQAPDLAGEQPVAVGTEANRAESTGSERSGSAGPGANDSQKSIAVLPFVNLSSDPEQEYFSDGISEELLNVLAQIPELRVAARTSSFQFKGDNRDIGEIARLLNVNHVLEGSVRKAGTRLRITAQLIEADNGYHLWSETYDRELDDVFAIQDEISAAIGTALKEELGLTPSALNAPRVAETSNTAAYEAYLKGRYFVNQRGNRAIAQAVRELEKSIRLDPNFAPAQAQLAIAIALSSNHPSTYGDLTVTQVNERAVPHAVRAMELNPELAEAWGAKAIIASANGDFDASIEYAREALARNPVYTDALNWIQTSAIRIGRYQAASEAMHRLIETDPLSVVGRVNYISNRESVLDPAKARANALALAENHKWAGYTTLSNVSHRNGELSESLYWLLKAFDHDPLDRYSNQSLVFEFCHLGFPDEARRVSDVTTMWAEARCGDIDVAIDLLERQLQSDPGDEFLRQIRPSLYYWNGDKATALAQFQELAEAAGDRALTGGGYGLDPQLQYAWLLQQSGRGDVARSELSKVDRDLESRDGTASERYAGVIWDRGLRAFLAGDRETALAYFQEAVNAGQTNMMPFRDPMLEPLRENKAFTALRQRVQDTIEVERRKALVMLCTNNPVPDSWQPLASTCQDLPAIARSGSD